MSQRWSHVIAFASDSPQAGKDTLAAMALQEFTSRGYDCHHLKFATPLKKAAGKLYRGSLALLDFLELCDSNLKDTPLGILSFYRTGDNTFKRWAAQEGHDLFAAQSPREVLRAYGTGYVRGFLQEDSRWSDWVAQQIEAASMSGKKQKIIITDLRFPHEWAMLVENGAKVVYIHGPNGPAEGVGEGLINPKACDYLVHNIKGNPQSMLTQLTMQQFFWKETQE